MTQRVYSKWLYVNVKTGDMRLRATKGAADPREVVVRLKISVDVPPEQEHLLEAKVVIPPRVVEKLEADQIEALWRPESRGT